MLEIATFEWAKGENGKSAILEVLTSSYPAESQP